MPSRWFFALQVHPRAVQMHHVHGALSRHFDHRSDGSSDFALCPPELGPDGTTRVEVRLLSDERRVVDRLAEGMVTATGRGGLQLGPRGRQRTVSLLPARGAVTVGPLSLVEAVSWEELARMARPLRQFGLKFQSPTFSRRGNVQLPLPLPGSVVKSIERHWAAHAPGVAPRVPASQMEMDVVHLKGETLTVELDHDRWTGFVGEVHYLLRRGRAPEELALGQLMASARFTGVGSMVAYGFGVVEAFAV